MANIDGPWVGRGTRFNYGIEAGIFANGNASGSIGEYNSFRLVLTIA